MKPVQLIRILTDAGSQKMQFKTVGVAPSRLDAIKTLKCKPLAPYLAEFRMYSPRQFLVLQ